MPTPVNLPSVVRNWFISHYLRDPMPSQYLPNDPEPMALARFDEFAEFLMNAGIDLLPNLDNWKAAGCYADIFVHHSPSTDPKRIAEYRDPRLKLLAGRHRLIGIRRTVLTASTEIVSPPAGTGTATPPNDAPVGTGAREGEGGKPASQDMHDGPFDANGFRYAGIEVKFGRAAKQYKLVKSLWDAKKKSPAAPRQMQDVITAVWGHDNDTEDATCRKLCSDVRARFQLANCLLDVVNLNGTVQLKGL